MVGGWWCEKQRGKGRREKWKEEGETDLLRCLPTQINSLNLARYRYLSQTGVPRDKTHVYQRAALCRYRIT